MTTGTTHTARPSIVRIAAVALVLAALLLGHGGIASAHTTPVFDTVYSASDDADTLWSRIFAESGLDFISPSVYLVNGPTETGCGSLDDTDIETYCPADQSIYLGESALEDAQDAGGSLNVAVIVADAYGFAVLDQLGYWDDPELELGATCLAGYWAWYADQNGKLDSGAIGAAQDFYVETFRDGDALAQAFLLGYQTDKIDNCLPSGTANPVF